MRSKAIKTTGYLAVKYSLTKEKTTFTVQITKRRRKKTFNFSDMDSFHSALRRQKEERRRKNRRKKE